MSKFNIEGPRTFIRISDENGNLVAYVGHPNEPGEARRRAQIFVEALEAGGPLETPNDQLGVSVYGCAAGVKHEVVPDTVRCVRLDYGIYVLEATCKHCGISGSRRINLNSFNWD